MKKNTSEVITLLEEFFVSYLPDVKGVQKNTISAYQYAFQLLFRFLEEREGFSPQNVTFKDLGGTTIEKFLLWLEQERGCSVSTRNLRRAAVITFAKFSSKRSFSAALPFYTTAVNLPKKKVKTNAPSFKHFLKEEISILLKTPDTTRSIGQRDVTLLSLLYASGARAQEICDIRLKDITLGTPTKIRLTGKGPKARLVTVPEECTRILQEYLRSRMLDPSAQDMQERHLFSSQTNEHMSISCVEEIVKKYVAEAKAANPTLFRESYTPHSFRHSIAVHMLESGESLIAIRAFLGHASISTTAIYAQVTPELASKYLNERGKPLEDVKTRVRNYPLPQAMPWLYK